MFSMYGYSPGWVYKGMVHLHSVKYVGIHLVSFWALTVGIYAQFMSFHVDFHICMSLSCLVAEICRFKVFYFWPSKSSRIDTIHRKMVSSVNCIVFHIRIYCHNDKMRLVSICCLFAGFVWRQSFLP